MPYRKYSDMEFEPVEMNGVEGASRAVVIGPPEGWDENVLRVFRIQPGGHTPHHQHDYEHVNHVIKGRGRLTLGEETFELSEKDFAYVPANATHQFENPYDEVFEFICIVPIRGA